LSNDDDNIIGNANMNGIGILKWLNLIFRRNDFPRVSIIILLGRDRINSNNDVLTVLYTYVGYIIKQCFDLLNVLPISCTWYYNLSYTSCNTSSEVYAVHDFIAEKAKSKNSADHVVVVCDNNFRGKTRHVVISYTGCTHNMCARKSALK